MPRQQPTPPDQPSSLLRYLFARAVLVLVLVGVLTAAAIGALVQAREESGAQAQRFLPRFRAAVYLSMDATAASALAVRMSTASSQAERRTLLDRLAERHQAMESHILHLVENQTDRDAVVALRGLRDSLMDGAVALSAIAQEEIALRADGGVGAVRERLDELEQRRRNLILRQQDLSSQLSGFVSALATEAGASFDAQRQAAGRAALRAAAVVAVTGLAALAAVIWTYGALRRHVVERVLALRNAMLSWRGGRVMLPRGVNDEISQMADTLDELIATVERRNAELEAMAATDALTGLANRRRFAERAEEEIRRARRYGATLSLVVGDIDHFKAINDGWGHDAGDEALCQVATLWRRELREPDLLARLGGEEFVALLPETDPAGAQVVAERIRAAIAGTALTLNGPTALAVTISLGVAGLRAGETLTDLMRRADQAMYQAKHAGRNAVRVAG